MNTQSFDVRYHPQFRAILAKAWDEGWIAREDQDGNYETVTNPYSGLPGDDAHARLADGGKSD